MTKKQRIAIARIVSDMIKADNIIEESEIREFNRLKQVHKMDSSILVEARNITFSSAVNELQSLSDEDKVQLFRSIRQIALVDGSCVPREALLLLALRYAFGIEENPNDSSDYIVNPDKKAQLVSCPTDVHQQSVVIYIEGEEDKQVNETIKEHLIPIVLRLCIWGFDFVYIPSLIKEFKSMKEEYVKDVISYMAPELKTEDIKTVYKRLKEMTTRTFCNFVLAERLHVDAVKNAVPSLFINIGISVVPYTGVNGLVENYTDFLHVPLSGDINARIDEFIKAYGKLVSRNVIIHSPAVLDDPNRFKFFGFYKAMFDFLVRTEPKKCYIIVHPWNPSFNFPGVKVEIKLQPQEAAIYKLILTLTYDSDIQGLPLYFDRKNNAKIEKLYSKIYQHGDKPLPDNESLKSIISRIKSKFERSLGNLVNRNDFIPKHVGDKYVVTSSPDLVKLKDFSGDPFPLTDFDWIKGKKKE